MEPYLHHAKYYETDQMGIIHHSNFIRWMEEARIDALTRFGISYKEMEEQGIISPVLSVFCEYKSMVHFDDEILVFLKVAKYNGIKLELEYEMKDKKTEEIKCVGKSTHCFLDTSGKPVSLKRINPEIDKQFTIMLQNEFYRGI